MRSFYCLFALLVTIRAAPSPVLTAPLAKATSCSAGTTAQCCQAVQTAAQITRYLSLLDIAAPAEDELVGLTCNPIDVVGVAYEDWYVVIQCLLYV